VIERIYGQHEIIGKFVASLIEGVEPSMWGKYVAVGFGWQSKIIGGAVFNEYSGFDVNITIGATSPRWCTKGVLGEIAQRVYEDWGCKRMTALVGKNNKTSRKLIEGVGFKLEGKKRGGFDGLQDLMIYGMLKDECKWLEIKPDGLSI